MQAQGAVVRAAVEELADLLAWARQSTEPALSSATWLRCTPGGGFQPVVASRPQHKLPVIFGLGLARGLHITEPEVLEAVMNRTVQTVSFKSAMPALALGAVLMLFGPTAALAQRGGGGRGGHSGGAVSGRSFSGGGGRSYSARRRRAVVIPAARAAMPLPTRAAAIPAGAATTAGDTPAAVTTAAAPTTRAGSTPAEATTGVEASGLVRISASGSASHSAGATTRVPVAATMTDMATGSPLHAIRTRIWVTERVAVGGFHGERGRHRREMPPA